MSEIKYIEPKQETQLYDDVCQIIDGARGRIATYVNTEACLTNWYVGKRIKEDVLFNQRAEYGKQVVRNLSSKLTERYGSGWSEKAMRHCLRSAETFSEEDIVTLQDPQLSRGLGDDRQKFTTCGCEKQNDQRVPVISRNSNFLVLLRLENILH